MSTKKKLALAFVAVSFLMSIFGVFPI